MGKVATYEDVIKTIADNYREIEHSIANQLLLNVPNHYPTEGSYRETVWKSLFEMVIPRKYCIEQSVFIIDSFGHKSKEVDLAIFDELYTPYIFNYGEIKFIPIEAAVQDEIALDWSAEGKLRLLESENIKAEIIYIGGGNAVALFRDRELFRETGKKLGIKAAENCQGLSLVISYIETDLLDFADDRKKLDEKLDKIKRNMIRQPVYSPFPVTEQDSASYQPITHCMCHGGKVENVTSIQFQKRNAYQTIGSFQRLFPKVGDGGKYDYPEEMDQLCRKHGENSQIAIVHIDGNGMGEYINSQMREHKTYSEGVFEIRKISREIASLFQNTYAEVVQDLWDKQMFIDSGRQDNKKILPLRPIILDGDDFTFLCRAELAVPVTARFMLKLMQKQKTVEQKITACGGIAFVHSHFPFRVAYSIAEESCSRAKNKWYSQKGGEEREKASCYLDFQIIKETEAELPVKNKAWQMRPYAICMKDDGIKGDSLWALHDTLKKIEDWPSGRLQRIYRAFQDGEDAMELLKREFASRGYEIEQLVQGKWQESPLFDALELRGMCHQELFFPVSLRENWVLMKKKFCFYV